MKVDYLLTIRCEREGHEEDFPALFEDFKRRVDEIQRESADCMEIPCKDVHLRWVLTNANRSNSAL